MNFKHQIFVRLRSSTHGRGPCYGGTATASVKITWPSGYNYRQSGTHTHTHILASIHESFEGHTVPLGTGGERFVQIQIIE